MRPILATIFCMSAAHAGDSADPPVMSLDEDADGVVRVFQWLGI